jgi:hypothetical protein
LAILKLSNVNIVLYPSPSHSILNISGIDKSEINLIVMNDIQGKTVLTFNNQNQINISVLKNGIYILKIQTEKGNKKSQFIKK